VNDTTPIPDTPPAPQPPAVPCSRAGCTATAIVTLDGVYYCAAHSPLSPAPNET
jgi:hypothetical protein